MTKLEELKKKHAALKAEITKESKAFFKEASASIFEKYPMIESFAWRQYTPYFNDGDSCEFGVYSDPQINGIDEYDSDEKKEVIPATAWDEIRNLIDSIDVSTMKEMFGDHAEISVSKNKVDVNEYSHD